MYRIMAYNEPTDTAGFIVLDQRVGRTVLEGKLTLKETDINDLTLVVGNDNPLWDNVKPFHTHVDVYDDDSLIFRGRAIKPKKSMETSGMFRREYVFEDIEAYLLDSVQRFYEGVGEKPVDFLKHLIEVHNSQVDKFQQFEVRNVTVTDSKDDAYRQIDYPKTRDAIKDKLLQSLGGYVVTTYKPGGPNYLDYLKDIGQDHKNDTPIQLSRNMKSASVQIDPTKVITRLVPLGKTLEPETVTVDGDSDSGSTTGVTQAVNGDWTEAIKNAAYMMGITDLSQNDIDRIKSLIQHESNGNETIQNNWDSNAAAGHPSIGLIQYIQPTFDSYKVSGYENIRVGFHQLLALFNDSNWRSDIRLGGWGPTGSKRMDKPAHTGSKNGGDGSQASDKSQEVSNKDSARPKLTITDVNGGKDWIDIPELQKEFGIIEGTVEFDDVTDANVLMQQAQAWIKAQTIPETWSVTAVELGLPNFKHFRVSDRYNFINPYVATTQLLRVVQKEVDLLKPHASTLTIGDKAISLTGYQLEVNRNQAEIQRVRVLINQMAAAQVAANANPNPVVTDNVTGKDLAQLKYDMQQVHNIVTDQIPAGYVSQADFDALKKQVEALRGGAN